MKLIFDRSAAHSLWDHLLRFDQQDEHAAFAFFEPIRSDSLVMRESMMLHAEDFAFQSGYHIELADQVRSSVLQVAARTGLVPVEFHSHLGEAPPAFSASDLFGFNEWVPHVRWRLRGSPYGAVVVSSGGFDGLFWSESGLARIAHIQVDKFVLTSCGNTRIDKWPFEEVSYARSF